MTPQRWTTSAWEVFRKELRIEIRSRQAIGSTVLFAVMTLAALAYLLALKSAKVDVDAALLWIVLFFSAMAGLARTFVREEEMGTADALRLTVRPSAVYAGKLLFNWVLLAGIAAVTVPLFIVVLAVPTHRLNTGLFLLVLLLGVTGVAAGSTFIAALVAQASSGGVRGTLFFVAAFPVLLPVLLASVGGTLAALSPVSVLSATGYDSCVVLLTYNVVVVTASFLLFGVIWGEP